jgi:acylphosphatase
MKQRAHITVKGYVKRACYREVVQMIARRLEITGHVGYLEGFQAEIVAEGEQENLKEFIEAIQIDESPIKVMEIEVVFQEATGKFTWMDIRRGKSWEETSDIIDGHLKRLNNVFYRGKKDRYYSKNY